MAPQQIEFIDQGIVDAHIHITNPLELGNPEREGFYHALIHELSHHIDWERLDLEKVKKLKQFVRKLDLANYLKQYAHSVFTVLSDWAKMPVPDALTIKKGAPLLFLHDLPDKTQDYRTKLLKVATKIGFKEEDIRKEVHEFMRSNPAYNDENDVTLWWNIVAHKFVGQLQIEVMNRTADEESLLNDRELLTFSKAIIDEVSHFLVGPIYAGGRDIFTPETQLNTLFLQATQLENIRMQLTSPDGRVVSIDKLREVLYPEKAVPTLPENSLSEWPPNLDLLTQFGAAYEGEVILPKTEESSIAGEQLEVTRIMRAYTFPPNDFYPDQRLCLLLTKIDSQNTSDPSSPLSSSFSSIALILPNEKQPATPPPGNSIALAFSDSLQITFPGDIKDLGKHFGPSPYLYGGKPYSYFTIAGINGSDISLDNKFYFSQAFPNYAYLPVKFYQQESISYQNNLTLFLDDGQPVPIPRQPVQHPDFVSIVDLGIIKLVRLHGDKNTSYWFAGDELFTPIFSWYVDWQSFNPETYSITAELYGRKTTLQIPQGEFPRFMQLYEIFRTNFSYAINIIAVPPMHNTDTIIDKPPVVLNISTADTSETKYPSFKTVTTVQLPAYMVSFTPL